MEQLSILQVVLFLVGAGLCAVVIFVVNNSISAKKRKKTKLGLVKVAGAGLQLDDGEPSAAAADSAAEISIVDVIAPRVDEPEAAEDDRLGADAAAEADESVDAPLDYVDVDINEEAVETMAMPLSAVISGEAAEAADTAAEKPFAADKSADVPDDAEEDSEYADKPAPDEKSIYGDKPIGAKKNAPEKKRLPETVKMKDRMVLLVEDVEVNREIVTMFFEGTGVKFDYAENGLEAYDKFTANPKGYSLILMDIQMPGMDGYDTARKIRALDADWAKQIPIIAMTANVFKEDIDACFDAGMDDHVAKPLDMEELQEKVFEFIAMNAE